MRCKGDCMKCARLKAGTCPTDGEPWTGYRYNGKSYTAIRYHQTHIDAYGKTTYTLEREPKDDDIAVKGP